MIDIDLFAPFNDAYGRSAGDGCLRTLAGCLRDVVSAEGFGTVLGA
jgi:GGDEF domain-containing protein